MTIKTVAAIIERGKIKKKVLLMKRLNTHVFEGFWSLPGGKINKSESPEQAVVREIKEETNLSFKPKNLLGKYHEHFPEYGWKADALVFTGTFSGELKPNEEESSDMKWFSEKEIKNMKFAFHHKKVLEDYFKRKKQSLLQLSY